MLYDIRVSADRIEIRIRAEAGPGTVTEFIGSGGRRLGTTSDNPAVYVLSDEKTCVRARVTDTLGRRAWIQPVFVVP